jgi:hypothetical protein
MDVFLERCAGLDVHQASVVCCVLIGALGRKPQKLLRSSGMTTRDLKTLRAWLPCTDPPWFLWFSRRWGGRPPGGIDVPRCGS